MEQPVRTTVDGQTLHDAGLEREPAHAADYPRRGSGASPVPARAAIWRAYRFYVGTVLSFVLVAVYLNLPNYSNTVNAALPPKYWYFLFLVMLFPLFLQTRTLLFYVFSPFALWAAAFIAVNLVHLWGGVSGGQVLRDQAIESRVLFLVLATFFGFAFASWRGYGFDRVFRLVAMLGPCLVLLDFLVPGLFYALGTPGTVPGRGSATYINPTIASEVLLIAFLLACPSVRQTWRLPLFFLVGIGVAATFSRSGIVAWFALWLFLQWRGVFPRTGYTWIVAGLLAIPFVLAAVDAYLGTRTDLDGALANLQERLNFFSRMHVGDQSALERLGALRAGWDLFLQYPVEGAGAAATSVWFFPVGTHNQIVMQAAEYGMVGIGFWLAMLWILWSGNRFGDRNLQLCFVFLFAFFSMFTHNMFDMLYWLLAFALVSDRRAPQEVRS